MTKNYCLRVPTFRVCGELTPIDESGWRIKRPTARVTPQHAADVRLCTRKKWGPESTASTHNPIVSAKIRITPKAHFYGFAPPNSFFSVRFTGSSSVGAALVGTRWLGAGGMGLASPLCLVRRVGRLFAASSERFCAACSSPFK
jgi:hypothetical protein